MMKTAPSTAPTPADSGEMLGGAMKSPTEAVTSLSVEAAEKTEKPSKAQAEKPSGSRPNGSAGTRKFDASAFCEALTAVLSLAPKAGLVVQAVNYHELDRVLIRIENVRVCPGFDGVRHVVPAVRMAGTDAVLCDECDKTTKLSILTPLGASESGVGTLASDVPPTATTRP